MYLVPPLTYSAHIVLPLVGGIYHLDVVKDYVICMMDHIDDFDEMTDDDVLVDFSQSV